MRSKLALATILGCLFVMPALAQGNEIHACVRQPEGAVRIVDSPGDCRKGETALHWASAPDQRAERRFEFVGCTENRVDGGVGILRMNGDCRLQFGASARMCTSAQILDSPGPIGDDMSQCWVRPIYAPHTSNFPDLYGESAVLDVAGETNIFIDEVAWGSLSCRAWTYGVDKLKGYTIGRSSGRFFAENCDQEFAIACCSPHKPIPPQVTPPLTPGSAPSSGG